MVGAAVKPILTYDTKVDDGEIFVSADNELVYEYDEEEELSGDDFFGAN